MDSYMQSYQAAKYSEVLDAFTRESQPGAEHILYAALSALALKKDRDAVQWVEQGLAQAEGEVRANLLAVSAYMCGRRGQLEQYRTLSAEASRLASTPLTLYHLGLSSAPAEGEIALREMLSTAEYQQDPYYTKLAVYALALNLQRQGKYRQAYSHACLASLRHPTVWVEALRLNLALLVNELEQFSDDLQDLLDEHSQQETLLTLKAEHHLLQGEVTEALQVYEQLTTQLPLQSLPYYTISYIRTLVNCGQARKARKLAEATRTTSGSSPLHQALAHLAQGIARYPQVEAEPELELAYQQLKEERSHLAATAVLHLIGCKMVNNHQEDAQALIRESQIHWKELGESGLKLLAGAAYPHIQEASSSLKFYVLGDASLYQDGVKVQVRPKGISILVMLLDKPGAYDLRGLAENLYFEVNTNSMKVELHRLKTALDGGITPQPYRVTGEVWADFLEVRRLLWQGEHLEAVNLYRGDLLPGVDVPGINDLRESLKSELIDTVLEGGNPEAVFKLAQLFDDDLIIWDRLLEVLAADDPRRPAVQGRKARLDREYDAI